MKKILSDNLKSYFIFFFSKSRRKIFPLFFTIKININKVRRKKAINYLFNLFIKKKKKKN
jgi:hypothetical protein